MNDRITTLLVDDEPMSRAALRINAGRDTDLAVVGECADGSSAVHAIRSLRPELVLLDVQMPLLDGFEVLTLLDGDPAPVVVFVTAFDEYAVRAFEIAAADFLLKPFDSARFDTAVGRAKDLVYRNRSLDGDVAPGMTPGTAIAPLTRGSGQRGEAWTERLLIRDSGRIYPVPVGSINWIESASNYLRIHTRQRTHLIRMKISDMERLLDPRIFARVHRTKIVNMYRIASLKPVVNGNYVLTLKDGTEMRMSRTFSHKVLGADVSAAGMR
jgi:two-component system, LytTR family, response regulator